MVRALAALVAVLWLAQGVTFAADAPRVPQGTPEGKSVLLLYSHEREMGTYAELDHELRLTLEAGASHRVEFFTEYLDLLRFPTGQEQPPANNVDYLRTKYAGRRIDLIVTISFLALDFMLENGDQLFPHTPVVFSSVNESRLPNMVLPPNITGIAVKRDVSRTLDLVLQLHPDTDAVVIPAGTSAIERTWTAETRKLFQPYEARVRFEYLNGLTMDEILTRLKALPPRTIVLFSRIFYYDGAGHYFLPEHAMELFSAQSSVPIYGTMASDLGSGIVGGVLYELASSGAAAGRMGLRILAGEAPSTIPVETLDPNPILFDGRQLERWQIAEARLPAGAVVRFRVPSLWRDHGWKIMLVVAIAAVQSVLIAVLLFEHRRRQSAEGQARRHLAGIAHLERRAAMGEMTAALAHELHQPLGAILRNAEAGKMMASSKTAPLPGEIAEIFEDIRKDDKRAGDVIRRVRALLQKHELELQPVDVNDLARETLALLAPDAAARGVRVDVEMTAASTIVRGDRVHLQQVLLNLIVNGMEAMLDTPVERRRLLVRTASNDGRIDVSVRDAGEGIPAGALSKIFEAFYTTKPQGMGMGLSVARSILEAHDGHLVATNNAEGGATVSFSVPEET